MPPDILKIIILFKKFNPFLASFSYIFINFLKQFNIFLLWYIALSYRHIHISLTMELSYLQS
jgi:hypothetical protein